MNELELVQLILGKPMGSALSWILQSETGRYTAIN